MRSSLLLCNLVALGDPPLLVRNYIAGHFPLDLPHFMLLLVLLLRLALSTLHSFMAAIGLIVHVPARPSSRGARTNNARAFTDTGIVLGCHKVKRGGQSWPKDINKGAGKCFPERHRLLCSS